MQLSIDLALCRPKTDVLGSHHYHCNLSSENHLHKYWYFPKLPGNNSSICSLYTIAHPNLICELPKYKQDLRLLRYFRAADHQTLSATTEVSARLTATSVFPCCRPSTLTLTLPKYKQNWRLLRYFPAPILTISLLHYRSTCRNVGYFGIFVLPFYQTLSATTEVHARMPVTSVTASAHLSNLIKNTEVIAYLPFTSVFPISRHSSS